jgi:hypothetical protein
MLGKTRVLWLVAVGVFSMPSPGTAQEEGAPPLPDLVIVQVPVDGAPASRKWEGLPPPSDRYLDGTRIVRVHPSSGGSVLLTPEFAGACDPDVSFDGETILFAGKREADSSWQIWRMNADGSEKVQITTGPGWHVAPVHAGARFYLDDPQPTPQIIYAGEDPGAGSLSLYGTDLDGTSRHRLTFNPLSDFSPAVLPTGRVVFGSWQPPGDPSEPRGHVALLSVNIDGTDLMPFYGNHESPRYRDMPGVAYSGDRVYFVESDRASWLGGGRLASVSWRRPLSSYGRIQADTGGTGVFHSPTPIPGGGLLASFRHQNPDSVFAVYRVDPKTGRRIDKVFGEPGWHTIDPQPLTPRPPVKGRSNWLRPGSTTGVFYCLDCYRTNLGTDGTRSVAPPGAIKHVRVLAGPSRRILGIAPVEADGSFHIRVPAETPITFQLLDEDYLALRSQRSWIWVMGNENRGCIGCHEDRELSPPNRMADAISKPPVDLVLPAARRRSVDFRHRIGPLLASTCATAGCHGTSGVEPRLGDLGGTPTESALREIYQSLVMPPNTPSEGLYIVPGSARSSPLIRRLLGAPPSSEPPAETHHDVLARHELILLIEWIDLGAKWESEPGDDGSGP